jgi:hypothetical protein
LTGTGIGFLVGLAIYVVVWALAQATESSSNRPPFIVLPFLFAGVFGALIGFAVKSIRRRPARRR